MDHETLAYAVKEIKDDVKDIKKDMKDVVKCITELKIFKAKVNTSTKWISVIVSFLVSAAFLVIELLIKL